MPDRTFILATDNNSVISFPPLVRVIDHDEFLMEEAAAQDLCAEMSALSLVHGGQLQLPPTTADHEAKAVTDASQPNRGWPVFTVTIYGVGNRYGLAVEGKKPVIATGRQSCFLKPFVDSLLRYKPDEVVPHWRIIDELQLDRSAGNANRDLIRTMGSRLNEKCAGLAEGLRDPLVQPTPDSKLFVTVWAAGIVLNPAVQWELRKDLHDFLYDRSVYAHFCDSNKLDKGKVDEMAKQASCVNFFQQGGMEGWRWQQLVPCYAAPLLHLRDSFAAVSPPRRQK